MIAAVRPVVVGQPPPLSVVAPSGVHPPGAGVLDRRGGPRRGTPLVDRFTAASHRPLPLTFAVGAGGHWAVMAGVSRSPHGILLRMLDPNEARLEAPERDVVTAWRRLATHVGRAASPLWYSSAAVAARAFVGSLASSATLGPISVELVVLDGGALEGRRMRGVLGSLADPSPGVLGVLLEADDGRALGAACGRETRPTGVRPPADLWLDAPDVDRPRAERVGEATDGVAPPDPSEVEPRHLAPAGALGDAVATEPSLRSERAVSPDPRNAPRMVGANGAMGATPVTDPPPAAAASPKRARRRRSRR